MELVFFMLFLFVIFVILIISLCNYFASWKCCICGESNQSHLKSFDLQRAIYTPSSRISPQKFEKADAQICISCLDGVKAL